MIKIVSYWKWFLISLAITFSIAYQVNIRKQKIYALQTSIAIKEENNPFFTSNTSLVFNWGGSSDQVQNISNTLKSRSHNELVVDELQFYIDYLQKGDYNYKDVYGEVPFALTIDKSKGQLLNSLIEITFVSASTYELRIPFENATAPLMYYGNHSKGNAAVVPGEFKKQYQLGEQVQLPFLNWKLESVSQGAIKRENLFSTV